MYLFKILSVCGLIYVKGTVRSTEVEQVKYWHVYWTWWHRHVSAWVI